MSGPINDHALLSLRVHTPNLRRYHFAIQLVCNSFKEKFMEDKRMHVNRKSRQGRRTHIGHGKSRVNVEEYDRLSSLPDDLIHKILSFISIEHAIRASVLSSRWRLIWTSMRSLNFSSQDLSPDYVSNVLSRYNNQIQVYSVKLALVNHESVKRILNYTFSHNVPQLNVTYDNEINAGFSLSLFRSKSLKHLTLSGPLCISSPFTDTPSWDLPALTTLHLDRITLTDNFTSLFAKCTNLNYLSFKGCKMMRTNYLKICHPRLSNLTLEHGHWWVDVFEVDAPQLKNLTITHCYGKHLISAPGLTSLVMKGDYPLNLSTKCFCSLEKLDLCIFDPLLEDVHKIVRLLQKLQSVKFLTLNLQILERLSSSMGLISHQPFAFANLKILKFSTIHPIRVYLEVQAQEKVTTFAEIKDNQLDTSPITIFTVVSCEEIRVLRDMASAEKLIAELRVGLIEQFEQRKIERLLMTKLQHIEGLLTQLPASKSPAMQATFSNVCEEASIVTNNMLDSMKIQYNKKRKCSNV